MDPIIKSMPARSDSDLMLCEGVAYQADMTARMDYDAKYFESYKKYETSPIAHDLNTYRVQMTRRNLREGIRVLDIGIGSGAFLHAARARGLNVRGFDVNPSAVEYLQKKELYSDSPEGFDALTFWDSMEHIEQPGTWLEGLRLGGVVLVSIPLFDDLNNVRDSKHYKPGEHLYYWTRDGFITWMALRGFRWMEYNTHESEIGRESIGSFAFKKAGS